MIQIKEGASVHGLGTEILIALLIASKVYEKHGIDFVITSGTDGVHGYSSEHYKGDAIDVRTRNITPETKKNLMAGEIKQSLGNDYDVVLESTHLHIEYDPK